jgi:hypothetical protein
MFVAQENRRLTASNQGKSGAFADERSLVCARFVLREPQIPDAHLGAQAFVVFITVGIAELSFQFVPVEKQ